MRAQVRALLLLIAFAFPALGAQVSVDWEFEYVNVRSGPGIDLPQVGRLSRGAEAELLERKGDWSRIRYSGGEGWVVSRSLAVLPEAPAAAAAADPPANAPAVPKPDGDPSTPVAPGSGDEPAREPEYLARYMDDADVPELDPGSNLVSMFSGLLVVLALVGGAAYVARRFFGRRLAVDRRGTSIQILSSRPLGPRTNLVLVEAAGLVWLLSQGPEGVTLIAEITDAAALDRLNARYGFLETPFEAQLRKRLDLESDESPGQPEGTDAETREPSPEERLAALRGRPRSGNTP